jgi:hypothetical protein
MIIIGTINLINFIEKPICDLSRELERSRVTKPMELIMSTLTWWSFDADDLVSPPRASKGFFQRLIEARGAQARRHVHDHLAAMDDARLRALGFGASDIRALRSGEFRLPSR